MRHQSIIRLDRHNMSLSHCIMYHAYTTITTTIKVIQARVIICGWTL